MTNSANSLNNQRIYCNRTLNLRGMEAVGFDMDYTLVNYHTDWWEGTAFNYVKERFIAHGWPVSEISYRPELCTIGLIIDGHLGNVVKTSHFGHVRLASHGTRMLSPEEVRTIYGHVPIDLSDKRWRAVDTLFSLSETSWYMQLVDLIDVEPLSGISGYLELHKVIRDTLDATHMEGRLKGEIVSRPEPFVEIDERLPLTLLDLKNAEKKLILITNSEWSYTASMMSYVFDAHLPKGQTWRDLFHLILVQARKPSFFSERAPALKLVDERGYFEPILGKLKPENVYIGGNARLVEESLGLNGEQILYFGDHIFADVYASKDLLRWRTALVVRELETELEASDRFRPEQTQLAQLMKEKEHLEHLYCQHRLSLQRISRHYGPQGHIPFEQLKSEIKALRGKLAELDERISPLARRSSQLQNERWGLLMRAGNEKSQLARQIERYADIYTSRVSNLLRYSPYAYLRATRGSVPHDSPEFRETSEFRET